MSSQPSHRSDWSEEQVSVVSAGEECVEEFILQNPDIRESYKGRHLEELWWNLRSRYPLNDLMSFTAVVKDFDVTEDAVALVIFNIPETGDEFVGRYKIPQSVGDVSYDTNRLLRLNAYASHSVSYVALSEGDRFPLLLDGDIYEMWI